MTQTVKFTANTTWQEAAEGPLTIILNPMTGFTKMVIGEANTLPVSDDDVFYLKSVAGENYLEFELEDGDSMYLRAGNRDTTVVSWIEKPPAA